MNKKRKYAGVTPIKKRDIPGAPIRRRRKSRVSDVEDFIHSGDEAWKIELGCDELVDNVLSAYRKAIQSKIAYSKRVIAIRRDGAIYLVAKDILED